MERTIKRFSILVSRSGVFFFFKWTIHERGHCFSSLNTCLNKSFWTLNKPVRSMRSAKLVSGWSCLKYRFLIHCWRLYDTVNCYRVRDLDDFLFPTLLINVCTAKKAIVLGNQVLKQSQGRSIPNSFHEFVTEEKQLFGLIFWHGAQWNQCRRWTVPLGEAGLSNWKKLHYNSTRTSQRPPLV